MRKPGMFYITALISLVFGFGAVWIGEPIRLVHYVFITLGFIFMLISGFFYFGLLETTREKMIIVIVMILTFLFTMARRYLF